MMSFQKLFKRMQNLWDVLSKKEGKQQDKFVIYLLLIEAFVIIFILGIHKKTADLAVALGTISMALAIVYIEIIKPWLQKPKIKIEFENEAPFCRVCLIRSNVMHFDAGLELKDEYGYFIRLRIRNIGGSLAKNLRGKLVEITKQGGELDTDFDPLFLHWTTIEQRREESAPWANYLDPLDLNPTEFDYLDIFKLVEGKESEERPIKIIHTPYERGCKKDLGMSQIENTFKITIYGENIEPVTETYKLKWDGKNYKEIKMCRIDQRKANNGQTKRQKD